VPREPGVSHMPLDELERARRELAASLALSRSGTLAAVTAAQLGNATRCTSPSRKYPFTSAFSSACSRPWMARPPGRVRGDHDCPIAIATSEEFPPDD
jgi:hypothetical protein